jgi:beta-glucosidase-like glycosyl hydrolase
MREDKDMRPPIPEITAAVGIIFVSQAETATMGVAATFSVEDAEDNGAVISREDRALGIDVSLHPFINIDRDSPDPTSSLPPQAFQNCSGAV